MVHQIESKTDFDEKCKEAAGKLIVIDFFATWCGPCKMIEPHIKEFESLYSDVMFLKVDVDSETELPEEYDISCMPTFVFLKNGTTLEKFSGSDKAVVKEKIEKYK